MDYDLPQTAPRLTRVQDKTAFKKLFVSDIHRYQFRRNFFSLYDDRCFHCHKPTVWMPHTDHEWPLLTGAYWQRELDIDHHIPWEKGGLLEAGNLVALCKRCNNKKRTSTPSDFYDQNKIEALAPYLIVQFDLFPSKGHRAWFWGRIFELRMKNPGDPRALEELLVEDGIEPELAYQSANNPNHDWFMGSLISIEMPPPPTAKLTLPSLPECNTLDSSGGTSGDAR